MTPEDDAGDLVARLRPGAELEAVPLFPIRGVVLFPGMLLPLHVFEPRYRVMTEHVLSTDRLLIPITEVGDGTELAGDPATTRPLLPTRAGLGRVVGEQRLEDGRYNLLVRGLARVDLEELPFVAPFRRAKAVILASLAATRVEDEVMALTATLRGLGSDLSELSSALEDEGAPPADRGSIDPGVLADRMAAVLLPRGEDRQAVLEELRTSKRVETLCTLLAEQNRSAASSTALN